MPFFLAVVMALFFSTLPLQADREPVTQLAAFVNSYNGGYKDDYPQELVRVQSYILPIQSDIATQLGLQYGQGFIHPVTIHFEDGVPSASENPFFYVRTKGSGDSFNQELVVNVEAYAKRREEMTRQDETLRGGFRYALATAMLNDSAAGDSDSTLPLWIHEGLAVYASGHGDGLVQSVAERTPRSRAPDLVGELNNPGPYLTARAWAGYYLAVKYIYATGGIGALQAFVRDVEGGRSASDAVRSALSQEWPAFVASVRAYSGASFASFAPADDDPVFQSGRRPRL